MIAEMEAYVLSGDAEKDAEARQGFVERWNAIGFVPFKEKEVVGAAYKAALQKFPSAPRSPRRGDAPRGGRGERRPLSEKERLSQKYNQLQQEIQTYENNIGFFGLSKGAESLKAQMQERIDAAKAELAALGKKIREIVAAETEEQNG